MVFSLLKGSKLVLRQNMATINPGTGGTFKSVTVESLLCEMCQFIQTMESDLAKNPNTRDYVVGTYSQNQANYTCNFTIPLARELSNTGQLIINASEYLVNTGFVAGTGGTFKSTTLMGMFLEVIEYIQILENNAVKNPTGVNRVSSTINNDSNVCSGSINIAQTLSNGTNGAQVFTAKEYLLT